MRGLNVSFNVRLNFGQGEGSLWPVAPVKVWWTPVCPAHNWPPPSRSPAHGGPPLVLRVRTLSGAATRVIFITTSCDKYHIAPARGCLT